VRIDELADSPRGQMPFTALAYLMSLDAGLSSSGLVVADVLGELVIHLGSAFF
jgi:hypothetical protein